MAECPVCMEVWTDSSKPHLPKILGCGHTLCEDCCGTLSDGGKLECPTCRKEFPFTNAKDVTTNFSLIPEANPTTPPPGSDTTDSSDADARVAPTHQEMATRLATRVRSPRGVEENKYLTWVRTNYTKRVHLQPRVAEIRKSTPETVGNYVVRYLSQNAGQYHLGRILRVGEDAVFVSTEIGEQRVAFDCISNGDFKDAEAQQWLLDQAKQRIEAGWSCPSCTFQNTDEDEKCTLCETVRGGEPIVQDELRPTNALGATVVHVPTPGYWVCSYCTFENPPEHLSCGMCACPYKKVAASTLLDGTAHPQQTASPEIPEETA